MISTIKERKNALQAFLLFAILFLSHTKVNAQWISKKIDNGFDDPVNIAYVNSTTDDRYLKLENFKNGFEDGVVFFLGNEYFCGGGPIIIELSFQVNGQNKKYTRECILFNFEEMDYALISKNLFEEDFLTDFKACTTMKIRVNDHECEEGITQTIYTFKMTGSSAALSFVSKI
jgi:hypothetical protein